MIGNPEGRKIPDEQQTTEVSPIQAVTDEAFDRIFDAAHVDGDELGRIMEVTTTGDPDAVAAYREKHRDELAPESIFFLEMSEAMKRSKAS